MHVCLVAVMIVEMCQSDSVVKFFGHPVLGTFSSDDLSASDSDSDSGPFAASLGWFNSSWIEFHVSELSNVNFNHVSCGKFRILVLFLSFSFA